MNQISGRPLLCRAAVLAVAVVAGCNGDPASITEPLEPLFDVISGTDECPDDAPNCDPATSEQRDELREIVEEMIVGQHIFCLGARAKILQAIDDGKIDTFQDYTRWGWHVKGSFNTGDGRYSFNESFFVGGGCNMGWCNSHGFGTIAVHEAGHNQLMGGTEAQMDWFESNCVDW